MKRKIATQVGLVGATAVSYYFVTRGIDTYLPRLFLTLLGISINYAIFRLLLDRVAARKIAEASSRYSFRRSMTVVYGVSLTITALAIWVENPQALLLSSGILAAGAAIALQDFFKSFVAGISILATRPYRVGDRIEIDSKKGDVIDVGLLYTLILEIGEWVSGDQPTGRLLLIPNSRVFLGTVINYTKDHPYIWDEISLPVTYASNWERAAADIERLVASETREAAATAGESVSRLGEKYFIESRNSAARIFIKLTDNWIMLRIRYVTPVNDRAVAHDRLSRLILDYVARSEDVRVASETLSVSVHDSPGASG